MAIPSPAMDWRKFLGRAIFIIQAAPWRYAMAGHGMGLMDTGVSPDAIKISESLSFWCPDGLTWAWFMSASRRGIGADYIDYLGFVGLWKAYVARRRDVIWGIIRRLFMIIVEPLPWNIFLLLPDSFFASSTNAFSYLPSDYINKAINPDLVSAM